MREGWGPPWPAAAAGIQSGAGSIPGTQEVTIGSVRGHGLKMSLLYWAKSHLLQPAPPHRLPAPSPSLASSAGLCCPYHRGWDALPAFVHHNSPGNQGLSLGSRLLRDCGSAGCSDIRAVQFSQAPGRACLGSGPALCTGGPAPSQGLGAGWVRPGGAGLLHRGLVGARGVQSRSQPPEPQ